MTPNSLFMDMAVDLAIHNVASGAGGPFAAVIVRDGMVLATGCNSVTSTNDPTAHAEIVAIRMACASLNSFQLERCEIYSTCEPCPMCLGAIYWARPAAVFYASTHLDAAAAGFDDSLIYAEIALPPEQRSLPMIQVPHPRAPQVFANWISSHARVDY